jgi:hypothetical protein
VAKDAQPEKIPVVKAIDISENEMYKKHQMSINLNA